MASHLKRLRKRHDESDEWAVSFADMMTLLMCFFILMVSISAVDIDRYEQVAQSLGLAMKTMPLDLTRPEIAAVQDEKSALQPATKQDQEQPQEVRQAVANQVVAKPDVAEKEAPLLAPEERIPLPAADTPSQSPESAGALPDKMQSGASATATQNTGGPSLDAIMGGLQERLIHAGSAVQIERRKNSIAVRLRGPVFFALASADLANESLPFLQTVADEVRDTRFHLTVEGHTDDLPITSDRFPSNWELSSARAAAVARFMIEQGVAAEKIELRGYAHVRPLVPNLDEHGSPIPENRVLNRRVVIVISLPDSTSESASRL